MLIDHDPTKDAAAKREYPYGKTKIIAEREAPYGFWRLKLAHGSLPKDLDGVYTTIDAMETAIQNFQETKAL